MSDLAAPKAHYTHRVVALAVRLVVEDNLPYQTASWHFWRDHRVLSFPSPPSRTGWRPGGKKAAGRIRADYLDWALDGFSGYIAADELYDGPFCVLSIVDNRAFKRLSYEVLDHDPTHGDIRAFFQLFQAALASRGLSLRGITTDGSDLYPQPIAEVSGKVEHQVCRFHILAELNQAVLHAARLRSASTWPRRSRRSPADGPATPEAKRTASRRRHLQRKIGDLFEHRDLFVSRQLTPGERWTLQRISRGLASVASPPGSGGGDSIGCSTAVSYCDSAGEAGPVAGACQLGRALGIDLPEAQFLDLEKVLTDLDDSLLGSIFNAVERSICWHRKMQKAVYWVWTQRNPQRPDRTGRCLVTPRVLPARKR